MFFLEVWGQEHGCTLCMAKHTPPTMKIQEVFQEKASHYYSALDPKTTCPAVQQLSHHWPWSAAKKTSLLQTALQILEYDCVVSTEVSSWGGVFPVSTCTALWDGFWSTYSPGGLWMYSRSLTHVTRDPQLILIWLRWSHQQDHWIKFYFYFPD